MSCFLVQNSLVLTEEIKWEISTLFSSNQINYKLGEKNALVILKKKPET